MNVESDVKEVFRSGAPIKQQVEKIMSFSTFKEEDIIKAISKGGETKADIYQTLINLTKRNNDNKK